MVSLFLNNIYGIYEVRTIKGLNAMDIESGKMRINKITLWDFKNVGYGTIQLNAADSLRQEKANIMGLYGQNASGKTVIIEALAIIKHAISGERVPAYYMDVIAIGKNECCIEVEFVIINEEHDLDCVVIYKCTLSCRNDPNESDDSKKQILAIVSESLRARGTVARESFVLQNIALSNESCPLISPAEKCTLLFGRDSDKLKTLETQKILALYGSRSFIFSKQTIDVIYEQSTLQNTAFAVRLGLLIMNVVACVKFNLYVINEASIRNLGLHTMLVHGPMKFPWHISQSPSSKYVITKMMVEHLENLLPNLNQVISSIVPGLILEYKCEKTTLDENDDSYRLELFSKRDGLEAFPFQNESLGLKKIVSFIIPLIEAYNNPGFTLAIDELDSGIFEYLLGEILDLMGKSGNGQLIFTSHNLRPLEKLDPRFVWFTTTDPENRYVQMKKKATNNLRDMYFRAIQLGHEDKELYNGDSKHSLAYAFRKMRREEQ